MAKYVLTRKFWDGSQLYERGDIYDFEEGKAPSSAVLASKAAKPAEPELVVDELTLSEMTAAATGTAPVGAKKDK